MIGPYARCPVMCEDTETGGVLQCGRWIDHEYHGYPEHFSYGDIIREMTHYLAKQTGIDDIEDEPYTVQLVYIARARTWYRRAVLQDTDERDR